MEAHFRTTVAICCYGPPKRRTIDELKTLWSVPIDIEGKAIGESSDAQARRLESHFIQTWITLPAPVMYITQGFLSHSCTRQPGNEAVVWYAFVRSWLKQLHF